MQHVAQRVLTRALHAARARRRVKRLGEELVAGKGARKVAPKDGF